MKSNRKVITVDYEQALDQTISIRECLPENHLARFVVTIVAQLDLSAIYQQFAPLGAPPYAPELLLALLFYAYASGVFSSRKIEKLTYESIPFRYIAGGLHPDHDTIANFRQTFLPEIGLLFVQILVLAGIPSRTGLGVLKLGNISMDGSKIHTDASKSKAVSYKRLLELETKLHQEVEQLLALGQQADQLELPAELDLDTEVSFRTDYLATR